jgi:sugar phosphate isomerase/epimerase
MADYSRRAFIASTAAALAATPAVATMANDAPTGPKTSKLKLSLAAYSFNRLMVCRGTADQIASARMSIEKFIDFCAQQDLGASELTSYYFPKEVTEEYLTSLKAQTHRLGLSISGTAIGNDFCVISDEERAAQLAHCRQWIDYAAKMGAPAIRIFAGKIPKGDSEEAAINRCAAGINESLQFAAQKGVFLALENHGGITSTPDQMFRIIDRIEESPWFGINLDSGNFRTEDPYGDLAKIAPLAVNAQVKVMIAPNGQKQPADFKRLVGILKDAGYRGFVAFEYEERDDPFTAIPKYLDELRQAIG